MVKCIVHNDLIMIIELIIIVILIIIVCLYSCLCRLCCCCCCCCCLFVCLYVCSFFSFFPFAKLVRFRFLSWFSISLTCSIYIHVIFFLYISPRLYKYFLLFPSKAQCHFFVYLKVDDGQLESLPYFDHHNLISDYEGLGTSL